MHNQDQHYSGLSLFKTLIGAFIAVSTLGAAFGAEAQVTTGTFFGSHVYDTSISSSKNMIAGIPVVLPLAAGVVFKTTVYSSPWFTAQNNPNNANVRWGRSTNVVYKGRVSLAAPGLSRAFTEQSFTPYKSGSFTIMPGLGVRQDAFYGRITNGSYRTGLNLNNYSFGLYYYNLSNQWQGVPGLVKDDKGYFSAQISRTTYNINRWFSLCAVGIGSNASPTMLSAYPDTEYTGAEVIGLNHKIVYPAVSITPRCATFKMNSNKPTQLSIRVTAGY